MGKWLIRICIIIAFAVVFSYTPIACSDDFFSVIYTVIGIMFSVAISQIMSFSFSEVENNKFVQRYRNQLSEMQKIFVILFSIATIVFLMKSVCSKHNKFNWKWIRFDIKILYSSYLLFSISYFIGNFISLAKLKNEIEDEIRKAKKLRD